MEINSSLLAFSTNPTRLSSLASACRRSCCWLSSASTFLPTSSCTCFSRNCSCLLRAAWCSSNEWVTVIATSSPCFSILFFVFSMLDMAVVTLVWVFRRGTRLDCTSSLNAPATSFTKSYLWPAWSPVVQSWQMSFSHSKQYNVTILLCFWQVEVRVFVGSLISACCFFISEIGTMLCPANALFVLWRLAQAAHTKRQVWQKEVAFVWLKHAQLWQVISSLWAFFKISHTSTSPLMKNTVGRELESLPVTATTLWHWGHSTSWSFCCCSSSCCMHPWQKVWKQVRILGSR